MKNYAIESTDFEIELLKKLNYWDDLKHNYLKQFKTSFRSLYKKVGKYKDEFKSYKTENELRKFTVESNKIKERKEDQSSKILQLLLEGENPTNQNIKKKLKEKHNLTISNFTILDRFNYLENQGKIKVSNDKNQKRRVEIYDI